jgi:hypothetical protein
LRWCLDLKRHVTVKWANTFSTALFVTTTKSVVQCTQYTLCVAGLSCDQRIMEYTRYGYCKIHGYSHYPFLVDVILTTAAVPPWHAIVTSLALVSALCPLTVWTPTKEYAKTAAVERQPWRSSRDIVPELRLSEPKVFEVLLDHQSEKYPFIWKAYVSSRSFSRPTIKGTHGLIIWYLAVTYISKIKRLKTCNV